MDPININKTLISNICDKNINAILYPGAHVPLTTGGNIVVDGILASCYASFDHDLAHLTMMPIQWFPRMMEWTQEDGTGYFVSIAKELGKWMLPYEQHFNK